MLMKFSTRLGFEIVVFILTGVVMNGAAHAGFTAMWERSFALDADNRPAVGHGLSLGEYGREAGLGFSNWRDQINKAAQETARFDDKADPQSLDSKFTLGFGQFLSIDLGWSKYTRNNQYTGARGIGIGYPYIIGFYSKNYFTPPKKHAWNGFWQWGTWYLLIPWIGFGAEYTWDKAYFEIGTFYIIPYPGFGIHF